MQPAREVEGALESIGERDHTATAEYRIFGPPGTGKTTNLSRQIRRAVDRFGPDSVLVTSFTRAAAAELAGRDLPIRQDRIGTLHSHCWRALDGPAIAETQVEEWNRSRPNLRISPLKRQQALDGESGADDSSMRASDGDRWLQELSRCRGMMLPEAAWPAAVRSFARRWTEYKQSLGLLDFCDLIETALREIPFAPGQPSVIFADEAQDLNRMQLSLVRKWGERAQYFILAADDDQTIYSWTGATPDAVLDPEIPEDHKIILKQSYRVPRSVHSLAQRLIQQVGRRQPKDYRPCPADGECHHLSLG
ncbi:MAG: ATP-dependent helicase, partial [Dehalococcoidia bacterium]|nr:ATP-dependent helicase [Dehalococcoidia bacterium]